MPLTRYQIRNEYSLADPKLYLAADKDDPEALLEGVAMAGLVGVLRQLGDLAEFAAEIFHDLHEEVMATSARGHGLMARVQQLEVEFPSIEKAFLAQTNHTSLYYNAGVDWHSNLRMDQNLITQGDLPRFVMDSYEECRGPPRLFILDKFDVAGAGACLKRYTNPSFFKVEAAFSGTPNLEVQRDKKIRKVKKKGARGRNGETPEVLPTSNVKLHQLFLEERVENGSNDPARLVKLKKRQLNGSPFDSQTKKSYMLKLLQTPSPEHRVVHEITLSPLPPKLSSNSIEPGSKILDIQTVNSTAESLERSRSRSISPIARETILKPSMGELSEEFIDGGNLKVVPTLNLDREMDDISSRLHEVVDQNELAVDRESEIEGSVNGSRSDDVASEADSFMDALNTLESEIETDTECRPKNDLGFFNVEKHRRYSDANEEHHELQAPFSDSQSVEYSNASDYGNISFKKGTSSFSYSDPSCLADNTPSDGDGAAKVFPSTENCVVDVESVDTSSDKLSINDEILGIESHVHLLPNGTCTEVVEVLNNWVECGEANDISNCSNSNSTLLPLDLGACSREVSLLVSEQDVTFSDSNEPGTGLLNTDTSRTNTGDILLATDDVSDIPSLKNTVPTESHPEDNLDDVNPNVLLHRSSDSDTTTEKNIKFGINKVLQTGNADVTSHKISYSDSLVHLPIDSDLAPEKNWSENVVVEVLRTEYADDDSLENVTNKNIGSRLLNGSSTEEQFLSLNLSELEPPSGITLQPNYLPASTAHCPDAKKPNSIVSENDAISAAVAYSENSTPVVDTPESSSFSEQKFSIKTDDFLTHEINSADGCLHSRERTDLEGVCGTKDFEEVDGSSSSEDGKESGPVSSQFSSEYPNYSCPNDLHKENMATETIQAEAEDVMAAAAANIYDGRDANHQSQDFPCSSSMNMQESLSSFGDSHQKGLKIQELSPRECLTESDAQEEVNQSAVGPGYADSMPLSAVSYDHSSSKPPTLSNLPKDAATKSSISLKPNSQHTEFLGDISGSSQIDQDRNNFAIGDFITSTPSSKQNELDIGSDSPHQTHFSDNSISAGSLSTSYLTDSRNHLEQALELRANQLDVKSVHADEAITKLSILHSEWIPDSNQIPQERCFSAHTESSLEGFPGQSSMSDLSLQSARIKLETSEKTMAPLESGFPSLGLLPQASQVSLEDMPPLPPLPPMQWRIGRFQHASLDSERQSLEHSLASFPPILPSTAAEDTRFGSASGVIQQPQNPFFPPSNVKDEKLQQVSEYLAGPSLFSLQLPTMVSGADNQHNLLIQGSAESLNPSMAAEDTQFGSALEGVIQKPQNPFLPPSDVKHEKLQQVSEHLAGPSLFSLQLPTMVSGADNQHNLLTQGSAESLNPSTAAEDTQFGSASEGVIQKPQNPFLPPLDVKHEKLQHVSKHLAGPSLFSLQLPTMVSGADNQHNLLTQGSPESLNPFIPLQAMPKTPQDGFLALEGERTQLTSNPFSLEPPVEIASTLHAPVPLPGILFQPPNQQALERDLEINKFLHTSQNSEGEKVNNPMEFVPPPMLEDQQPQLGLQISREIAWSSSTSGLLPASENGKPYGDTLTKVPRPRNPIIDAVAAHGKIKLRKVTERTRPQIEHKVDERDSLLEQIRTKSFSLKPAIVTRPSIQGPKTNLKVAAILEKANAIRQALAGSDDDEEDNWSDN